MRNGGRQFMLVGLCSAVIGSAVAAAQVAPAPPVVVVPAVAVDAARGLTLSDAIGRALENSPDVRGAEAEVDMARGDRAQAALRPNPAVNAERGEQLRGADSMTSVGVMWPLDVFRRPARVAVADRGIEAASGALEARRRAVGRAVAASYGDWVLAAGRLDVADRFIQSLEQTFDLVRARAEAGAVPVLERNIAEVALLQARAERFGIESDLIRARIELLRIMGDSPGADIAPRQTLEELVGLLSTRTRVPEAATAARLPDVLAAQARIRLADAAVQAAASEGRANYDLALGYKRTAAGFPFTAYDRAGMLMPIDNVMNSVSFGVTVSLPLRNRQQGAVAAARARVSRARFEERAERLTAEADVASAAALESRARQALAVYSSGLRDLARRNLDVVRETYTLGAATLTDVLLEQRRFLDVESAYLRALGAAYAASTAVLDVLGELR